MAYGDSLEATEQAAREGYKGIDKNLLSTSDLVPIVNHSTVLDSFLGGRFTHRWTGAAWGEGNLVLDPLRKSGVGARTWADVQMVTDETGKRRIHTLEEHVRHGIEHNVLQVPEAKAQSLMELEAFWENVRVVMERHGHPRVMMTLPNYGHPARRLKAAKSQGFKTAIIFGNLRSPRPPDFDVYWRPYVDALWGDAWGPLG